MSALQRKCHFHYQFRPLLVLHFSRALISAIHYIMFNIGASGKQGPSYSCFEGLQILLSEHVCDVNEAITSTSCHYLFIHYILHKNSTIWNNLKDFTELQII